MHSRSPLPLTLLGALLLLLLAASVTFTPIRADNDCWWHVKTGLYIAEHGIPKYDVFSFTAQDHRWDNHEWLSQVIMGFAFRIGDSTALGGWRAVILLTSLVSIAAWFAVALLAQARARHWILAFLLALLAVAIGRRTLYPRPPVVTYLFFALFLYVLYQTRLRRWPLRRLWVLIPFTALWSNLHGGWMGGLVAIVFFVIEGFLRFSRHWWLDLFSPPNDPERLRARPRAQLAFRDARAFAFLLVGCILASLANPYTYRIYLLPGRVMGDLNLVRLISELHSPDFYFALAAEGAILLAVASLAIARRRPILLPDLLLFLFWAHQGIQHVRHLPMFAVAATPLLAAMTRQLLRDVHTAPIAKQLVSPRLTALLLTLAAAGLAIYVVRNPRESENYLGRNAALLRGQAYLEENYPTAPCDFAELADIRGRVFNRNTYAGYLIWRLAPERATLFTDSRFDIFGGQFLEDEYLIAAGNDNPDRGITWKQALEKYQIDWILIPASEGLHARLLDDPDNACELAYVEPNPPRFRSPWVIWIPNTPDTEAMRERARRHYAILNPAALEAAPRSQ